MNITKDILKKIAPQAKDSVALPLVDFLNTDMPKYKVDNYLRVCHFLAQAALESDGYSTLEEYASGRAYEGRTDLGNTQPGDGVRFKGRGIFQLTGRANYKIMSDKLGKDLINHPELAATAEISVLTALEYWNSHNLSQFADADDVTTITRKINGGYNGLADRKIYLGRAKALFPLNFKFNDPVPVVAPAPTVIVPPTKPDMPTTSVSIVVAKIGDVSPYIKDLQDMLIKNGATIVADGNFGPKTQAAVSAFQKNNMLNITGSIDTDTLNKMMAKYNG